MPLKRGKSPGWAAFDLKQQQEQGLVPEAARESYPPMPTTLSSFRPCENLTTNNDSSARSFLSVLLPSVDFPTLSENGDCRKMMQLQAGDSSGKGSYNVVVDVAPHRKLKRMHSWADDGLIEDILAATDNNIDQASSLLKAMVSTVSSEENNKTHDVVELSHCLDDFSFNKEINTSVPVGDNTDFTNLTSSLKDSLKDDNKELIHECSSHGENISYNGADTKVLLGHLRSVPVEPEWVDNDMYLTHRKDAIRMMRMASQHSRAATSAFQRGDHYAAQQHSLKAQEERLAAERLNYKAAKEILSIRNSQNDVWKLDLHGLHAAEAVQALQGHLLKIETQLPLNRSVSPNKLKTENIITRSSSLESFNCANSGSLEKLPAPTRQRQMTLQVITGVGNHSQGQAALPIAVRSFLSENRYRFDETRPGVITVRPKFRHR